MEGTNFYYGEFFFKQIPRLQDFGRDERIDRRDLIRERIFDYVTQTEVIYRESDGNWRFGRCEKWDEYIIGKLGKIFTEERTVWNDEAQDYVTVEEELEVADVSFFIVDPIIEGIVFNRKLHTGSAKFIKAFATGYNHYYDLDGALSVELKRTGGDKHYSEILEDVRRVYSVDFDLRPVNPSADEEMEILDEHIKGMNADDMGLDAQSKEGLNYDEEFIRSAFALSDEGDYGDYTIRYQKSGETETYDSRGEHATTEKEEPEDLDDLRALAIQLLDRLKDLISDGD